MRRQSHQLAIAPALAFDKAVGGDLGAPRLFDLIENRTSPIDAPLHLAEEIDVNALIALDIVANASRRIEIDRLEWTHEGPAQGETFAQADIDVFGRRIAVGDETKRLFQQGALQAVHHKAVDLAFHDDRRLAGGLEKGAGALDHFRRSPWRRHDLRGRNNIGRIEWMDD